MKVVVCQGEPIGGSPTRDVLLNYWKEKLSEIKEVEEVEYLSNFNMALTDDILGDKDAILGAWISDDLFTKELFDNHPNLQYVATFGHGFGRFDVEEAKARGITFTNTIYGDMTIAQFGMALLLDICHNIRLQEEFYKKTVAEHVSIRSVRHVRSRQIELYGKTVGIIGLGNIGLWMAKMAAGFGTEVIAYSRTKKVGEDYGFIEQVSLDELLERSDVISIHCPLTEDTRNLINKESIHKMKDGVIIINTARGDIINEPDLIDALESGKVYAAGLDVVVGEPLSELTPIMQCRNAVVTPHIAWAPEEARYRTIDIAITNFTNWIQGKPTSIIP